MTVESLQKHINQYFTTIINIIHTYGGEVVKFAGDALYVVWRTLVVDPCIVVVSNRSVDDDGNNNNKKNVEKAVLCALHINKDCNNFEIVVQSSSLSSETHHNCLGHSADTEEEKSFGFLLKRQSLLSEEDEVRHESDVNSEEKFYLSGNFDLYHNIIILLQLQLLINGWTSPLRHQCWSDGSSRRDGLRPIGVLHRGQAAVRSGQGGEAGGEGRAGGGQGCSRLGGCCC